MGIYLNDWKESGREGMLCDFGLVENDIAGCEILLADYTYEDYEGSAFVLFVRDGKLYEVNAGHCSCYGLSEQDYSGDATTQFQPEETTKEAILKRIGHYDFDGCRDELIKTIESLS